jgi:cytochrome c oxidase subunit 3
VTRFVHDVSGLPDHAFDTRGQEMQWPPSALAPSLGWGTVTLALLLLSEIPNLWLDKAARAEDLKKVRLGLILVSIAAAIILVSRAFEFAHLNIAWDRNAYGSIVWALLLLHTVHLITDLYETVVLTVLMHTKHGDRGRRFVDTSEDALYWHFVVASWVLLYLVIYWMPRL